MSQRHSDVLIIGGGPAGYLAAERAAQGGLTVTLFEKRAMGGVCLNEGCIPTKTLLHSAKIYETALKGGAYGVTADNVRLDHNAVVTRKDKVVKMLVSGVEGKMKAGKISVIKSTAVINEKNGAHFIVEGAGEKYSGRYILLAAGSEPMIPPIPGLKEGLEKGFAVTSREILELREIPEKLTVIGAGVVGLEMAAYFATAGSKVSVIEMTEKIAGYTDAEIASILLKDMQHRGIDFKLGCQVTGLSPGSVTYEKNGKAEKLSTDCVLIAIGRRPTIQNLGFEKLNIHTERGAIPTDNQLRTNVSGVYAIGDINGKSMLAHTAYREAEVAVNHILGKKDTMRYDAIPAVIYTAPEVAGVGETEESAREKGLAFSVKKLSTRYSGRFVAENDKADGLCKLLIENGTERLIGAHLIGPYASEMIYGASMMIESRWPVGDLKELVFPHPTVSEIIRETFFN
ncbi:MAG: dihydrolipoyl dehydrogenase [Defluviitaleaceae bacterium]|nr:dihydrolipoyl dehydrogenase [Defluviitaleaceae bacterium]MCL2239000.1 dihydrolipoyl dehydrogenase [Defluviitaleaceae bacterium]